MDVGTLFFGFRGRLNRGKYWLAILVYVIISLVLTALAFTAGDGMAVQVLSVIVNIAVFISGLAVGIKRLHDRNKSGWWLLIFYVVPTVIFLIALLLGLAGIGAGSASTGIVAILLYVVAIGIIVWAFVELGCLRGTVGPNQYGPDPLSPGV